MVPLPKLSKKAEDRLIFSTLLFTLLIILWALSFWFASGSLGHSFLRLSFYDVGQGDAILIEREGVQILVDGGPNDDILSHLGRDLPPWDRKIELLISTHPHADHLTGLLSVLERYQVERVLFYPVTHETKTYQRFLEAIQKEEALVLKGQGGSEMDFSGLTLKVLWPQDGIPLSNVNNASVVLALTFDQFDVLLLGDAEKEAQARLTPLVSETEVLKVAHQGSWDGVYELLLRQASPELAVISVGANNRYGHPHQSTLDLLDSLGIERLRTDQNGTVKVMSNGKKFWYNYDRRK